MLKSHTQCLVLTWEEVPDWAVWTLQAVGADGIQELSTAALLPGAGSKSAPAGSLGGCSLPNFTLQTTLLPPAKGPIIHCGPKLTVEDYRGCFHEAVGEMQQPSRAAGIAFCCCASVVYLHQWSISFHLQCDLLQHSAHLCYWAIGLKTRSSQHVQITASLSHSSLEEALCHCSKNTAPWNMSSSPSCSHDLSYVLILPSCSSGQCLRLNFLILVLKKEWKIAMQHIPSA